MTDNMRLNCISIQYFGVPMTSQPTLIYLHGFNSSPASQKACLLTQYCAQRGLAAQLRVPALHQDPRRAMAQIEQLIAAVPAPVLAGASLGGYYATFLARRHGLRALLINPAVLVAERFLHYLGPQRNYCTGEEWVLQQAHVDALAELQTAPPTEAGQFEVWLETGDETLDWRDAAAFYRACAPDVREGGNHSYSRFEQRLPELLAFAGLGH